MPPTNVQNEELEAARKNQRKFNGELEHSVLSWKQMFVVLLCASYGMYLFTEYKKTEGNIASKLVHVYNEVPIDVLGALFGGYHGAIYVTRGGVMGTVFGGFVGGIIGTACGDFVDSTIENLLDIHPNEEIDRAYRYFGFTKSASFEDINKTYKELVKQYHPDKKTGNNKKFIMIQEMFKLIKEDNEDDSE